MSPRQSQEEQIAALLRVQSRGLWLALFPMWTRVAMLVVTIGALLRIGWSIPPTIEHLLQTLMSALGGGAP